MIIHILMTTLSITVLYSLFHTEIRLEHAYFNVLILFFLSYYDINLLYSRIHLKWISLCYCAKSWRQNTFRVFHWKCSTPLYSRSASLIGSAYLFLYISFCFWFNNLLTNLTSLRQHLQYIGGSGGIFCWVVQFLQNTH